MAILWSRTIEGCHYEVRSAGATLRLYRNGVNHSQWNPQRPLGGCIWDLLLLPALHRPIGSLQDALILGFGAGTVGRQLRDLAGLERIVGIDMDPIHLSIAEGFFECSDGCELVSGDAVDWVRDADSSSDQYDLIIDDLFGESKGIPVRFAPFDGEWFRLLARLLRPGGLLVFNMVEPDKLPHLAILKDPDLRRRFCHSKVFAMDGYENRIAAFSDKPLEADNYEATMKTICREYPRCRGVKKRYRIGSLEGSHH